MMLALDHAIFGNGHGLGSPLNDMQFYWLVDTAHGRLKGRNGQLYTYLAGFGAQLLSRQWRHPRPGERRRLANREFVVFSSRRRWLRVEVAWAMVDMPENTDGGLHAMRKLKRDLDNGVY